MDMEPLWADDKTVGNGGCSGVIYVPNRFAGYSAKVTIPDGNGSHDVITKSVGRGTSSGHIYVHLKHLGKPVRVVIPWQEKPTEDD